MSGDGSVSLFWGDAEHRFRFSIGQFRELQENVNRRRVAVGASLVGPMTLLKSLREGDAWPDDVRDVIRLGLNGGGMKPEETHRLLKHYFDDVPPYENMKPAFVILMAGLMGPPGEPVDSKKKSRPARRARSRSPTSTAPAQH